MPREHVKFRCAGCGLSLEADVGAEGASFHRAFWCPRDARLFVVDVAKAGFDGHCAHCHELMDLLADFPLAACPRCHTATGVEKTPRFGTSVSKEGGTGLPSRR